MRSLLLFSILSIQLSSSFDCGGFSDDGVDPVCYEIAFTAYGWNNARDICHNLGAEVASVHNDQENSFIRRLAVSNGAVKGVLLGGSVAGKGILFGWIDGSDWDYANFEPGYPKSSLGDCLYMDTTTTTGQWINTDCNTQMPVVCARSPNSPKPISPSDPRYPAYKDVSDLLGSWMNTSVDPCDDFYAFTCGAGKKGQPMSFDLSDDATIETMLKQLRQPASYFDTEPLPVRQMKWLYDSCLKGASEDDYAARSIRIFNNLRINNPKIGFPALYPRDATSSEPNDLAAILGYSLGTNGQTTLVYLGVDTDWEAPHNLEGGYALLVDQPATMFISSYYDTAYDEYDAMYSILDTINAGAKLLGINNVDQTQARRDAQDMADLDYALATKYSTDETTRRQYERSYNPYTDDGLQQLAPFLNWNTFFNRALSPIDTVVDGSFSSIVMEVDKLALLSADISSGAISARTLNNYFYIQALSANYLPDPDSLKSDNLKQFRREKRRINRKIRREPKQRDPMERAVAMEYTTLENYCQSLSSEYIKWANTRVYVDARYPTDTDKSTARQQASAIINSILAAFRNQIDQLDWMDAISKNGAYKKIEHMVVNIAFPDWVLNDAALTTYYMKLTTTKDDAFLNQIDKLGAFSLYEDFAPLLSSASADRTSFVAPATYLNVWYQPELNSITFPAGILQAPFYDFNYPAAMNYGGIGAIAGHELTHGFDDDGMQWDDTGVLQSWMDESSTKGFNDMAQCVVNEYNGFCPLGPGYPCVDGEQTQGENIADNGGIQAAYKAFKTYQDLNGIDPLLPGAASSFNADQLFFLGFAQVWCQYPPSSSSLLNHILFDPHSPSMYRVLGTLQNVPAFQKAFNCPVGSTYAPAQHCDVWSPASSATKDRRFKGNGRPRI